MVEIIDFWVLYDNEPLIYRSYSDKTKLQDQSQEQILGLLSALKSFSSDIYDTEFEGIELKGYKFYYYESKFTKSINITFCAGVEPKLSVKKVNKLFKKVEKDYIAHSKYNKLFMNQESIQYIIERLDKHVGIQGK